MIKYKSRKEIPDFSVAENNNVAAVYVINPRILELDNPQQRGLPFLFYRGDGRGIVVEMIPNDRPKPAQPVLPLAKDIPGEYSISESPIRPYVGKEQELDDLLKGRTEAGRECRSPEKVTINGKEVNICELRSGYVPFSFGVGHRYDADAFYQGNRNFRTDLGDFKQVLSRYDEEERAYKSTLGYKLKHCFGLA